MVGRRLISGRQSLGVEFDMRNALYAKLLRLSFGFYDRHQTGQLMSRATVDLQGVRFFLGYGLIFFFQHVLTLVSAAAAMFYVDWQLALVASAITPLVVVLAYRYSSASHPVLRDVQQKMGDLTAVAEESIVGVHVVKSFAQERNEERKFAARSENVFARSMDANRQRAVYVPLLSFLPLLAQAAVLLYGGHLVANGALGFDNFITFNVLVLMLVMPLRMLGMWIGQAQRATASGERIFEVIDEIEDVRDPDPARELPSGPGLVRFESVEFAYAAGRPVLQGIELDLQPGRTVALIGHTGSGKTTLASLVPRFYDVSRGRVTIDGADVRDVNLISLRRSIGVVAQDPFLFSASVRENIAFGRPDATDEEIALAARSCSCVPRAAIRPWSSTTSSSASASVDNLCAMMIVVRPLIASRSPSRIRASVVASTLAVASSRISTRGSRTIARAIAIRCRWPPESVIPRSPITVS